MSKLASIKKRLSNRLSKKDLRNEISNYESLRDLPETPFNKGIGKMKHRKVKTFLKEELCIKEKEDNFCISSESESEGEEEEEFENYPNNKPEALGALQKQNLKMKSLLQNLKPQGEGVVWIRPGKSKGDLRNRYLEVHKIKRKDYVCRKFKIFKIKKNGLMLTKTIDMKNPIEIKEVNSKSIYPQQKKKNKRFTVDFLFKKKERFNFSLGIEKKDKLQMHLLKVIDSTGKEIIIGNYSKYQNNCWMTYLKDDSKKIQSKQDNHFFHLEIK